MEPSKGNDDTWFASRIRYALGAELLLSLVVGALRGSGTKAVVVSASSIRDGRKYHEISKRSIGLTSSSVD